MGEGPGGAGRVGRGGARREAEALEPVEKIGPERFLPAHEMGAAGDVEEEPVAAADPDRRRVALAPLGQGRERFRIGLGVGRETREAGEKGLGVGERQAGADAGFLGRAIRRGDDEPAALGEGRDEGPRPPGGPRPRDPVGRESR